MAVGSFSVLSLPSVGVSGLVAVAAGGTEEDSLAPAAGVAGSVAEGCGMGESSAFTASSVVFSSLGLLSEAFCSDAGVLETCGEASTSLGTFWVCVGVLEPEAGGGGAKRL